ncbi:MAG: hypothetical protein JSS54_11925 [Proteobacteria bacterium]|nr:hypothetical protein [Pseudomonadota bacterium]
MRFSAFFVLCTIGASVGAVAEPALVEVHWNLFRPTMKGCSATNQGALDLHIKVNRRGRDEGEHGSKLVSGFEQGDTLLIDRKSSAGLSTPSYILSELDQQQIAPVLTLDRIVSSDVNNAMEEQVRFVIPPEGAGWALFSNADTAAGEGEYSITVRCVPRDQSSPPPVS